MPTIESVLINRPDEEAMGAGETTITLTAAAIGNAVFDATGARLREVPFTPERVKAALARSEGRAQDAVDVALHVVDANASNAISRPRTR